LDRNPGDAGHAGNSNGVDHGLGDEPKRSLRIHEKTTKDFEWRLAVEQSAEPVAVGVPYRILSSHAVGQLPIGEQLSAELQRPIARSGSARSNAASASGAEVSMTAPDGVTNVIARQSDKRRF